MFIFNSKLNWFQYASNKTITVVSPAGFALNDPVSAYWQWTVNTLVNKKASSANSGVIHSITTAANKYCRMHFTFGYYSFQATVTADYKTLNLTMRNPGGNTSEPFDLLTMHINPTAARSAVVYMSMLDYYSYAKSEMATLVVPYGVTTGAFFGLYHQWTVDSGGSEKTNHAVDGVFEDVWYGADGSITASFNDGYYSYNFTFNGKGSSWVLSNPRGGKSPDNKLTVAYEL
ncbi:hypothetical protein V8D89_003878 [Ganoderma adspersum]